MSEHKFDPVIPWGCLRDVIGLVRGGLGNLTPDQRFEIAEHVLWFAGCSVAKIRVDDTVPDADKAGILKRLLTLFSADASIFGATQSASIGDTCDKLEAILPKQGDSDDIAMYGGVPWLTILTVVLPLVMELIEKLRNKDEE